MARPLGFGREGDVQGRDAEPLGQGQRALEQGGAHRRLVAPGRVRKRGPVAGVKGTAPSSFGIIAAARPLVGVGPGMVEDVFALAVALQIEGHDSRGRRRPSAQRQVARAPALTRDGAARGLAGVQEVEARRKGSPVGAAQASQASRPMARDGCRGREG